MVRGPIAVGVALLAALASAGCAAHSRATAQGPVPAGHPGYALHQMVLARTGSTGSENVPPGLTEALPNHRYSFGGQTPVTYSDAVAVGTVMRVEKGVGVVWRDEGDYTVVGYDDAKADTRTALITMSADEVSGAISPAGETVTFRVHVPSPADPERFVEGLAGLARIAVVLSSDPTPMDSTPWRPIMDDGLIGVVEDDGTLTLPGLGSEAKAFQGDIDTEAALMRAARAPASTQQIVLR